METRLYGIVLTVAFVVPYLILMVKEAIEAKTYPGYTVDGTLIVTFLLAVAIMWTCGFLCRK